MAQQGTGLQPGLPAQPRRTDPAAGHSWSGHSSQGEGEHTIDNNLQ